MKNNQQYFVMSEKYDNNESHVALELQYGVLESELSSDDGSKKVYGITVSKNEAGICMEESKIYDVCCYKEEAIMLAEQLARNKVLPLHLNEVIEDYLNG